MYLWDTDALVKDLRDGPLPQHEQLKYLLFELGMTTFAISTPTESSESSTLFAALDILSAVALVLGGTFWCYRANVAGDGKEFVSRYLALLVPLSLRFMALILLTVLGIALVLGGGFLGNLATSDTVGRLIPLALGVLMTFAFYWRLKRRIQEVSHVG